MRRRREREMEREMRFHLDREAAERQTEGAGETEAQRAAALAFGSVEGWKDEARAARGGWSELLWRDARLAWRGLRRAPGFALLAVTVLALGIGANTAMFSVVQAVLLNPLPFPRPQRLMNLSSVRQGRGATLSYPDFLDLARAPGVGAMAAYTTQSMVITGRGRAQRLQAAMASSDLLEVLGVRPEAGRGFLPGESRPGALAGSNPVILSDAFARAEFGGARTALGRPLRLNELPFTVVGVMPAGFQFPLDAREDVWLTLAPLEVSTSGPPLTEQRGAHFLQAIARPAPGDTPAAAQARLAAVAAVLRREHPNNDADRGVSLTPMLSAYTAQSRPVLLLLQAATGCVLLIACMNVGGLLLARGARRRPEFALRFALGASRGAVLRQLACEGGLLGLLGALAGVGVAQLAIAALINLAPGDIVRLSDARLNGPVLLFTLATAVAAAVVFALLPAAALLRPAARGGLGLEMAASRRTTAAGHAPGWQRGLLVAQFGLTLAALFVAGVLLHSLRRLAGAPLGFSPERAVEAEVDIPDRRYPAPGDQARFFAQLIAGLRERPSVARAAAAYPLPLGGDGLSVSFDRPSHPLPPAEQPSSDFAVVTPEYFRALGIPLLAGRDLTGYDTHASAQVVIVNQAFARRYFGGNALGRRVTPEFSAYVGPMPQRTIVGVVGNTRQLGLAEPAPPMFYLPEAQVPVDGMNVIVQPQHGADREATAAIGAEVRRLDSNVPIERAQPIRALVNQALAPTGFDAGLLGLFAGLSLLLSAVGLYAVMAQAVALRRREIGIRMALGADGAEVTGMILRDAMLIAGAGAAAGVALTLGLSRLLNAALGGVLYRVSSLDPMALAGALALLLLVAVAATAAPARRAAKADPVAALRLE